MSIPDNRLIVVSNRLPFVIRRKEDEHWELISGTGGLVTALTPVLRNCGGVWVGWPGNLGACEECAALLRTAGEEAGFDFRPVALNPRDYDLYYNGYANESLWPLFHDLQSQCRFKPEYWEAYLRVNQAFAHAVLGNLQPDDFIWVHDYQLMSMARFLRMGAPGNPLAFFLHIPFPPLDIFVKLPERHELLHDLLQFDLVGLQTQRDRRNFIQCVRALVPAAQVRGTGALHSITLGERIMQVGAFPIGIDYRAFARQASAEAVARKAWIIHEALPNRQMVLGIDRLDYTKGIPQRMEAFRNLLERYPDLHGRINLIQVVVPSRVGIPKYDALKREIEGLVGEINGQFTGLNWVPIHYIYRQLNEEELLAYYRTAEIALITPLKDGMNLVSKEFCACSLEENSVLILSQFAGSAAQLGRGALLVNPYDVKQTANAIYRAFHMPPEERRHHMRIMRRNIRHQNIYKWVDSFIQAAINKELDFFPQNEDFLSLAMPTGDAIQPDASAYP
jgi:trehalose 6-phosphate synthase